MTTTTAKPASTKQIDLISNLLSEKLIDSDTQAFIDSKFSGYDRNSKTASGLIRFLFTMPRIGGGTSGTTRFTPEAGLYRMDDALYRVKISRTGNWYAEVAVKPVPGSGRKSLDWDYLGKRVNLADAVALSDAEAGKFVGYCVRCNAELTVLESIERGMGPVCAKKM